jgi:hypothetical protein
LQQAIEKDRQEVIADLEKYKSPDFQNENKIPYIEKKESEHEELFKTYDTDMDHAKRVEFKFIEEYLAYFIRTYKGADSLDN